MPLQSGEVRFSSAGNNPPARVPDSVIAQHSFRENSVRPARLRVAPPSTHFRSSQGVLCSSVLNGSSQAWRLRSRPLPRRSFGIGCSVVALGTCLRHLPPAPPTLHPMPCALPFVYYIPFKNKHSTHVFFRRTHGKSTDAPCRRTSDRSDC